jgi:hypothetical protein
MPLDDTNDAVPPAEHPRVETTPHAHARSAEPLQTSTTTDRATVGQPPAREAMPLVGRRADSLVEPSQAIHGFLVDLIRRSNRGGCGSQATSHMAAPSVDEDVPRRTLVQVAIPLSDNNGTPFPKAMLQPIFDEIYQTHGGATVRPAFGVCSAAHGIDVDALADFEVWTARPDILVEQVERWREILDQREIVIRLIERVIFVSVVKPSALPVAANDDALLIVGDA